MLEKNRRRKKKKVIKRGNPKYKKTPKQNKKKYKKYKKEEIMNHKNKKEINSAKNQDLPGKTHKLMEKFLNLIILLSQLLLRPKTLICKEEDAFTLYRGGLCASMTYPKLSQAIKEPRNHKNKIKRNPTPLNKYNQFKARSQKYKWKGKKEERRKGDVAL